MFDEKLYQETISALHASEDTISEVMNMTHKTKRRGSLRTAAVLAAVIALLCCTADWISGWWSTLEQRRSRKSCSRPRQSR